MTRRSEAPEPLRFRSVLLPLDGSPFAEHAVPWAAAIARKARARLRLALVHQSPPSPPVDQSGVRLYTKIELALRKSEREYLRRVAARIKAAGAMQLATVTLSGPPAPALADYAREVGVGPGGDDDPRSGRSPAGLARKRRRPAGTKPGGPGAAGAPRRCGHARAAAGRDPGPPRRVAPCGGRAAGRARHGDTLQRAPGTDPGRRAGRDDGGCAGGVPPGPRRGAHGTPAARGAGLPGRRRGADPRVRGRDPARAPCWPAARWPASRPRQ